MKYIFLLLAFFTLSLLSAREYFVALNGNDKAPGTRQQPFATFKKAVSLMQPGDTLTIMPGEYSQFLDGSFLRTSPDKQTVIRALIPGTVLFKGDVDAPSFKKLQGTQFTYVAPWAGKVEAVYEKDTFTTYVFKEFPDGMDFERGVCVHDPEKKLLYVVTTDGKAPDRHHLTISVKAHHAVQLGRYSADNPAHNVLLEGISVTGFNLSNARGGRPSPMEGIKGCYMRNSLIRNCDISFCGGGIRLWRPNAVTLDNLRTYGNGNVLVGSGGNIISNGPSVNCMIRNCEAFGSPVSGIRYYGGTIVNSHIENCKGGFNGYGDMWCKGVSDGKSFIRNCTALGSIFPSSKVPGVPSTEQNNVYYYCGYSLSPDSIKTHQSKLDFDRVFADADNWDFRLQSGTGIKAGLSGQPPVFFLSPGGKDTNDGRSIVTPWKNLKKVPEGSTVYLLPGTYAPFKVTVPGVRIAARSIHGNVIVKGGEYGIEITAPRVTVDRINFISQKKTPLLVKGSDVKIINCGFASSAPAVKAADVKNLSLTHCAFTGSPYEFKNVTASVHSNIMAKEGKQESTSLVFCHSNAFPVKNTSPGSRVLVPEYIDAPNGNFLLRNAFLFNGKGMLGFPIGPWRRLAYREEPEQLLMQFRTITKDSATVEFFNAFDKVENRLQFGEAPGKMKTLLPRWISKDSPFRTYTFNGLKPGKKYFIRIDSLLPKRMIFSNEDPGAAQTAKLKKHYLGKTLEFTTAVKDRASKEFHVSVKGSNSNPGTAEKPFRTITHAADQMLPGDTVTVHGGVYNEAVRLRSGGAPGRPLTFRTAPGEKVIMEGANQKLNFAFRVHNKSHVYIDGFRFRLYGGRGAGMVQFVNGRDYKVSRVIFDGRGPNYSGGSIYGEKIKDLLMENCMVVRGFQGMTLYGYDNVILRNNLFLVNQLTPLALGYDKGKITITNNIFFDTIIQKQTNCLLSSPYPEMMTVENNCFYLRIPPSERLICGSLMGAAQKRLSFTDFRKLKGNKESNLFLNPRIPAVPAIAVFKSMADRNANHAKFTANEDSREMGMIKRGVFKVWEWKDLFPEDAQCKKRKIGPDPAALKDFL